MLFSSIIFLFVFLPLVLIIYYKVLKGQRSRNRFLLLASLVFYAWGEPKYVFLMIGSIVGNFLFGLLINRFRDNKRLSKLSLCLMIGFNLSLLGIFKYLTFVIDNINKIGHWQITVPDIILPIGISFFTFHGLSYGIDIYRKRAEVLKSPLDIGLYITFFPQFIAGPIVRYETIAKELHVREETEGAFAAGVERFILGLSKKVILANNFALIADKAFGFEADLISADLAWMGAAAYMLQIYFDFSGYSDMAIGLGKMFGFHFKENFDSPYIAQSISDFWRRWHISLGSWFRDYVYFPLGGSRVDSKWKLIRNLWVVWLLTGLWHGANWTFILWGIYFFLFITMEKLSRLDKYLEKKKIIGHCYVIFIVLFGWILFRAENITYAFTYMKAMFGLNANPLTGELGHLYLAENKVLFIIGMICCLPLRQYLGIWQEKYIRPLRWGGLIGLPMLFVTAVAYLVKGTYNPFIYFNF